MGPKPLKFNSLQESPNGSISYRFCKKKLLLMRGLEGLVIKSVLSPEQDSWKRLPIKDMTADFFDAFFLYGPSWFDARGVVKQSSL